MNKTIAALSLLVPLLLTAAGVVAASTGAARGVQSASGSGQVHQGLPLRTFAFSATRAADGSTRGQAQVENRSTGFRGHIEIDCLNLLGNDAVMTGVWTSSTSPNIPVGSDAFFAVQDNGEGPNAPADEITAAFSGIGIHCTFVTDPTLLTPFLVTIESGQIQVHS
jgi:hypothetical protein